MEWHEPGGERRRRSFGSKRDAEDFVAETRTALKYGGYVADDGTTIGDLWSRFRASKAGLSASSVYAYDAVWAHHLEEKWAGVLASRKISVMRPADFYIGRERWRSRLVVSLYLISVNKVNSCLRPFLLCNIKLESENEMWNPKPSASFLVSGFILQGIGAIITLFGVGGLLSSIGSYYGTSSSTMTPIIIGIVVSFAGGVLILVALYRAFSSIDAMAAREHKRAVSGTSDQNT